MTFNIRHARGIDLQVDVARIADVINAAGPDIVALQEVDRGVERTNRRDLPSELARDTGLKAFFQRNIVFEGGDYGNAILSRFPVIQEKNELLPTLGPGERHGALQLIVECHGRKLLFVNTHIDHRPDPAERILSVGRLRQIVSGYGALPAIVCGDFNDLPGSQPYRDMREQFRDAWEEIGEGEGLTFPSDAPVRRIDYIWLSRDGALVPREARVEPTLASDHRPLTVDLEFRSA